MIKNKNKLGQRPSGHVWDQQLTDVQYCGAKFFIVDSVLNLTVSQFNRLNTHKKIGDDLFKLLGR